MEFATVAFLTLSFSTLIYFLFFRTSSPKGLPPGPKPWPIVGNLLQLSDKPHSQFAEFARIYGGLFSLRLGTETVIVASTPAAAFEILKTHDRILSARYVFQSFRVKGIIENSMVWSDCNEVWKTMRKICRTQILSRKMIESQAHVRESKALDMVRFLKEKEGEQVKISEVVYATLMNTFGRLIFSQDIFDLDDPNSGNVEMKKQIGRMLELGNTTNPADYFPFLAKFDLLGQRKDFANCMQQVYAIWGAMLKERKIQKSQGLIRGDGTADAKDFVDVLLDSGLNDGQINGLLMELFAAGTGTSTSTIEWCIAELTKNPHIKAKILSEITSVVGENRVVKESDFPNLPYLQAFTKETFRFHPATPLLIPRRAPQTCQVMNHTIPKDCQIMINAWAIGRDPNIWEDALTFKPERFLNSSVDFKGNDFELIPFGARRRVCPGVPLATQFISLIVATLVQNFEWELPNGMDPKDLSMDEKFGLALEKESPLYIVTKSRVFSNHGQ